jgi:hypothetical protein
MTSIASTYSNYVLPVDLDLPNWSRYQKHAGLVSNSGTSLAYNDWYWQDWQSYYTDNRFATSLVSLTVVNDVAFVLSCFDIHKSLL